MEERLKSDKVRFRKSCLRRLKRLAHRNNMARDRRVVRRLYETIREENARRVMLYIPMDTEVDLNPLIRLLRRERREVLVPFMEGASFRLVKYRYPLRIKKFGIKEPIDSKQHRNRQIDLAVVPIVGTDVTLRRIGFGKGMYDRFYEREKRYIKKTVFVTRELCFSKRVVSDRFDVEADMLIVP